MAPKNKMTEMLAEHITLENEALKEIVKELREINGHFVNGFRSELKSHISEEFEKRDDIVQKMTVAQKIQIATNVIQWASLIATLIVLIIKR